MIGWNTVYVKTPLLACRAVFSLLRPITQYEALLGEDMLDHIPHLPFGVIRTGRMRLVLLKNINIRQHTVMPWQR